MCQYLAAGEKVLFILRYIFMDICRVIVLKSLYFIGTKDLYSYTDEDGSKYYFKELQGATLYHNEDGLNITMTV